MDALDLGQGDSRFALHDPPLYCVKGGTGYNLKLLLFYFVKPATHLVILYADRGEFDREYPKRFLPTVGADTLDDFFSPIAAMWQL